MKIDPEVLASLFEAIMAVPPPEAVASPEADPPPLFRERVDVSLRAALLPVEENARGLPWARDNPWTVEGRVRSDGAYAVVDLHGLDCSLAKHAVYGALDACEGGALRLIHGRGLHSVGRSSLKDCIRAMCRDFESYDRVRIEHIADGRIDIRVNGNLRSAG